MSEAETHVMKARLHGGALNKALRGELQVPLVVSFNRSLTTVSFLAHRFTDGWGETVV